MSDSRSRKRVLIIGASFAGLVAARSLLAQKNSWSITIVEPRDYVENMYMNPRLLQEPERHTDTMRKLSDLAWLSKCTVIQGAVMKLDSREASISSGDTVPFDFCIICCGASPWRGCSWHGKHVASVPLTSAGPCVGPWHLEQSCLCRLVLHG